jgi:hypothetical protein
MTVVSLDMAYCSFREVLAGLDTRLNTPPSIDSRHPDSGIALAQPRRVFVVGADIGDARALRMSGWCTNGRFRVTPCGVMM